jgi:hypothetical protein
MIKIKTGFKPGNISIRNINNMKNTNTIKIPFKQETPASPALLP